MSAATHHEANARARKVARIAAMIDRELRGHELNPFDRLTLAKLLDRMAEMTPEDWAALCSKHQINAPSETTTAAVTEVFRARLAEVEAGHSRGGLRLVAGGAR